MSDLIDAPDLIETMLREDGRHPRLTLHLARLKRSCRALGRPFDMRRVSAALDAAGSAEGAWRVRLTLDADGGVAATATPFAPVAPGTVWRLAFGAERLDPTDPWLRHKTTRRAVYDAARAALPTGADEALLLNLRSEVCEGTITNLFVDRGDGALVTPPLACGVLPGVLRAELLASGRAREAVLRPEDLSGARIHVGNALRGLIPATLDSR